MQRIALVEDEPALLANYSAALRKYGYDVEGYRSRSSAWERFQIQLPDMAIIDVGLGQDVEGGFELCRQLRHLSQTLPILFLTARDSEFDQISGLRLGADDYLTKDISLPHLMARVTALFRRQQAYCSEQTQDHLLQCGPLTLDLDRLEACWNQSRVDLTVTEFWMVHALARRPGHLKSRGQLMDAANTVLDEQSVTSHIKRIRRKFQQLDPEFDAIQTAYAMGYRWLSANDRAS